MKRHRMCGSRGFTLIDVIAVVFFCAVTLACVVSCRRHHGEGAGRVKCASNLRQIGQALLLYANENKGTYPRTDFVEGPTVKPEWGSGVLASNPFKDENRPLPNDVTAALFLLLRTQDITPEVFVCPYSDAEPDDFGGGTNTAQNRSNFTNVPKNLSYSYANPYPNSDAAKAGYALTSKLSAEFAVAADMNPGMAGGAEVNVTTVKVDSPASTMRFANSLNHAGDGQNVLFGDGHVEFTNTPFIGVERDNIYTSKLGGIAESPADATDSVLLPAHE